VPAPVPAAVPAAGGGVGALRRREAIEGVLYISPWIVGFLVFNFGPLLYSLYLSLTKYSIVRDPVFIGLDNYVQIVTRDRLFWVAIQQTGYYAVVTVVVGLTLSLLLALVLDQKLVGTSFLRTFFYLPTLTPIVASVIIWGWIFHPQLGVLNYLLARVGVAGPGWLQSVEWAMPALLVIALWGSVGGSRMVIFIAGLQGIPHELYEAAAIDGASGWHRFRHVTVPMLSPTVFFNLVLGVIGALQVFASALVASKGGPAYATWFYALHIYNEAFVNFKMGYAAALAWIFFVIVLALTYVNVRLSGRWVYYAGESG
jgi:multiple sugar transport system permease protein